MIEVRNVGRQEDNIGKIGRALRDDGEVCFLAAVCQLLDNTVCLTLCMHATPPSGPVELRKRTGENRTGQRQDNKTEQYGNWDREKSTTEC